jgi:hypothetical protein
MSIFKAWWAEKRVQKVEEVHEEDFTNLLLNYLSKKRGSNLWKEQFQSLVKGTAKIQRFYGKEL